MPRFQAQQSQHKLYSARIPRTVFYIKLTHELRNHLDRVIGSGCSPAYDGKQHADVPAYGGRKSTNSTVDQHVGGGLLSSILQLLQKFRRHQRVAVAYVAWHCFIPATMSALVPSRSVTVLLRVGSTAWHQASMQHRCCGDQVPPAGAVAHSPIGCIQHAECVGFVNNVRRTRRGSKQKRIKVQPPRPCKQHAVAIWCKRADLLVQCNFKHAYHSTIPHSMSQQNAASQQGAAIARAGGGERLRKIQSSAPVQPTNHRTPAMRHLGR
jgi:hypothetical protein